MDRRLPALSAVVLRWTRGTGPLLVLVLVAMLIGVAAPAAAQTAAPIVDIRFEGDLEDAAGGSSILVHPSCDADGQPDPCNSASEFSSDGIGSFWRWESTNPRGGGFTLTTAEQLGETFTVGLRFRFDQVGDGSDQGSTWRKIIDYKDRDSDTGFYIQGGKIQFYNLGTSEETYGADEILDLVAVREGSPGAAEGVFAVYVIGADGQTTQILAIDDQDGGSIPATNDVGSVLGFFHDDLATSSEATLGGSVYSVRVWDRALEGSEIETALEVASVEADRGTAPEAEDVATPGEVQDDAGSDLIRWLVIGLLSLVALLVVIAIIVAVSRSRRPDQDHAPV